MQCIQIVATLIIHLSIDSISATKRINKMDAADDDENFRIRTLSVILNCIN